MKIINLRYENFLSRLYLNNERYNWDRSEISLYESLVESKYKYCGIIHPKFLYFIYPIHIAAIIANKIIKSDAIIIILFDIIKFVFFRNLSRILIRRFLTNIVGKGIWWKRYNYL
jgi:hypothetical protein